MQDRAGHDHRDAADGWQDSTPPCVDLYAILRAEGIIAAALAIALLPRRSDGLAAYRQPSMAVAPPETIGPVGGMVQIAAATAIPIVYSVLDWTTGAPRVKARGTVEPSH